MASNITQKITTTNTNSERITFPDELRYVWNKYQTVCAELPIALAGSVGCVFSMMILTKAGLQKPSNCLLLGLAISDGGNLLGRLNVPNYLSLHYRVKLPQEKRYFEFSYTVAFVLHVIYEFHFFLRNLAIRMTSAITVFITAERLIAVFLPLHFKRIVTAKRVWILMLSALLFWLPWCIYARMCREFIYKYDKKHAAFFGRGIFSPSKNSDYLFIKDKVLSYIQPMFPALFVLAGTIITGVKIAHINKARSNLVNNKETSGKTKGTGKTTKTLLAVCFFFCLYQIALLAHHLIKIRFDSWVVYVVTIAIRETAEIMSHINSSVNFFIYVILNKNFRVIFKNMIGLK